MGTYVAWLDEGQDAVYQQFKGVFSLDEYVAVERETHALIEQVAHSVTVVCDLSAARHLPSNLASLSHRQMPPPANLAATIVVDAPVYIRKLAALATRLKVVRDAGGSPANLFVDTMAEAREVLSSLRVQQGDH